MLLRNPILAGIFLRLRPSAVIDAPHTEYQIFDAFWERIAINAQPTDYGSILALADKICQARAHPLPRSKSIDAGVSEPTLERLVASGWVTTGATGEIGFTHDRLLNWATAKSLAQRFESGEVSSDQLADILVGEDGDRTLFDSYLGYVPMDVLWQLTADPLRAKDLSPIVVRLEQHARNYGEAIYGELLPTLGQRAIPILRQRLDEIVADATDDIRVGHIAQGFAALARQAAVELDTQLESLLRSSVRDKQNVALVALAAAPMPNLLDLVWGLHRHRTASLNDNAYPNRYGDYETSFSAMRAAVVLDPAWLSQRIRASATDPQFPSELAYLLCAMDYANAPAIWRDVGDVLMETVPREKPRCLIQCIARFRDRDQLDFVIGNLSRPQDFAAGSSLTALAILDPDAALDHLADVADVDRYVSRNQWLPVLLRADAKLTRRRILDLAEAFGDSNSIVDLFWERPHEIDEPLLLAILRDLKGRLRTRLDERPAGEVAWAGRILDFLSRVSNPQLLPLFEHEAGGELERLIVKLACGRLDSNSRTRDTMRDSAHVVLKFIGGEGAVTLLSRELDSEYYWIRHSGLNWAALHPGDRGIRDRLFGLATRPGNVADESSEDRLERMQAVRLLTVQGADAAMVEAIEFIGPNGIPLDLPQLRPGSTRIPRQLTAHARQILGAADSRNDELLVALIVANLSNDREFVSTVLSVLRNADADSLAARFACIALDSLGDNSDSFAGLADRLLRSSSNSSVALRSLVRIGEQGRHFIADWLTDPGSSPPDGATENEAISALYSDPRTKLRAVHVAADRCARTQPFYDAPFDIAAEFPDSKIRENVRRAAFEVESISPNRRLLAIEGLAKFDMGGAIAACNPFLQSFPRSTSRLCRLLVRIAPSEAVHLLMQMAAATEQERVRNAIGRELRKLEPERVSTELVGCFAGLAPERLKAAQLAAWIPHPTVHAALVNSASTDGVPEVRKAASDALEAHDREARVVDLLDAFPSAARGRQWSLLLAMLHAGDAHLLSDPDDALCLGHVLSSDSHAPFRYHANQVLRRRRDKEP